MTEEFTVSDLRTLPLKVNRFKFWGFIYEPFFIDYSICEYDGLGLGIVQSMDDTTVQVTCNCESWDSEEPGRDHLMDLNKYLELVGL